MSYFQKTALWLAIVLTLLCGGFSHAATRHPESWVGVWECKNQQSGYVVVRFPKGRIVGVDFERTDSTAKWHHVGSFTGRWERRGTKYTLDVSRHLITAGRNRKQQLAYRVGGQNATKLALYPNYDAPSMLEVKITDVPIGVDPIFYSPDALLAAYRRHFLLR